MRHLYLLPCLLVAPLFAGEEYDHRLPDGQSMRMVGIPAGEFLMGGQDSPDQMPVHRVRLSVYRIGKYEVTNRQYLGFCEATGRAVPPVPAWGTADDLPVIAVSWADASAFCEWAELQLPTEAEWEYAAGGGDARRYPWGNEEPDGRQSNYADNSLAGAETGDYIDTAHDDGHVRTAPVGSYAAGASPFGAMDMAGNVWEWCSDWYDERWYARCGDGKTDPECSDSAGLTRRACRSGCWGGTPLSLRVVSRLGCEPDVRSKLLGFRVVSRSTQIGGRPITPPAGAWDPSSMRLSKLASKPLASSPEDQVVSYEDAVAVTVPGGALGEHGEATISVVENAPPAQSRALQQMAVYDISIGEQHTFDQELTIEMAYDPAKLRADLSPSHAMWVGRLDTENGGVWVGAPFTVDEANHKLIVRTRHLSIYSAFMIELGYDVFDKSSYFTVVYNRKQFVVPDPKTATPEQLANAPMYPAEGAGNTLAYSEWPDVPRMVLDLVMYLEKAYVAYRDAGFKMPPVPIVVDIGPGIVSDSDARNSFSEIISMGFNNISPQQLFNSSAHELFHAVQNMYYWDTEMHAAAGREWWLDMTAEYAASKVARGAELVKSIHPTFFEEPFTLSESEHGQRCAHFLDYLIRKHGFDFKEMFETVAGKSDTLRSLEDYLFEKTQVSLGNSYREFAKYLLFNPAGPYKGELKCESMGLDKHALDPSFDMRGGYTVRYFGVAPETSGARNARTLIVEESGDAPKYVKVEILRLPGNQRGANAVVTEQTFGFKDPQRLDREENRAQMVDVPAGDALYVLVASEHEEGQTVRLAIYEQSLEISGGVLGAGVIGAEYNFAADGQGIPKDAEYTWSFGDGNGASGEKTAHKYERAGEYTLKLEATWPNGRAKCEREFVVAEDIPEAAKAEANIFVFRYFKNKMGKSKQACQGITVRIFDKDNKFVDGGSADLHNGLFSITLPVGHYTCKVHYLYSSPRDEGDAGAAFDVTVDGRNWVEVETPPYEAFDK